MKKSLLAVAGVATLCYVGYVN